jgi:hypothetical protein
MATAAATARTLGIVDNPSPFLFLGLPKKYGPDHPNSQNHQPGENGNRGATEGLLGFRIKARRQLRRRGISEHWHRMGEQ